MTHLIKSKMKLPHSYQFEAIGTLWSIETQQVLNSADQRTIDRMIEEFDRLFSRFRKDSLVTKMSKEVGQYDFPDWTIPLWECYEGLYQLTNGKVTPLIGSVLEKAGYDAEYTFKSRPQTPVPLWEDVIERNGSSIHMKQLVLLDLGAAGKGFLVDRIAALLDESGYDAYVIDASGDIRHNGAQADTVGLEHTNDSTKIIGTVQLSNRSLCASAVNRRRWGEDMHHVFDPQTLAPTNDVIATWVIAEDTMTADGIATALFFVGPDALKSLGSFDFLRVHADGMLDHSRLFEGQLVQ